jgi:hypothetical protein
MRGAAGGSFLSPPQAATNHKPFSVSEFKDIGFKFTALYCALFTTHHGHC